jgi:hypothetical protein
MESGMTLDTTSYDKAIKDLIANFNISREEALKQEMGLLVKELIRVTPPFGLDLKGKKEGQNAVENDIKKIYTGMTSASHTKWKKKLPNATTSGKGRKLFEDHVDASFHQEFRDRRGRVKRKGTRQLKFGKLQFSDKVHVNNTLLTSYIKKVQAKVGQAKAGWLSAARKFGSRGIPGWVSTHGESGGDSDERFNKNGGYVEAINFNKAIQSLNARVGILRTAFQGREKSLKARIQNFLEKTARKF